MIEPWDNMTPNWPNMKPRYNIASPDTRYIPKTGPKRAAHNLPLDPSGEPEMVTFYTLVGPTGLIGNQPT